MKFKKIEMKQPLSSLLHLLGVLDALKGGTKEESDMSGKPCKRPESMTPNK